MDAQMAEIQQSLQRVESGQRQVTAEVQGLRSEVLSLRGDFNQHRNDDRQDFKELHTRMSEHSKHVDACFDERDKKHDELSATLTEIRINSAKAAGASAVSTRIIYGLAGVAGSLFVAVVGVAAAHYWG